MGLFSFFKKKSSDSSTQPQKQASSRQQGAIKGEAASQTSKAPTEINVQSHEQNGTSQQGVSKDEAATRTPTAPTFHYFEGVRSIYDLNIGYVKDVIAADYYDFTVTQDTLYDLSHTIDLAKQDAMFALGGDDSYEGMLRNCRMIAMGRLRDIKADAKEQEFTVQVMRNYFLMRAIHFNRKQLQIAISLGGEAKYACYYQDTRSIPIIEACLIGVPGMVEDLIDAGADVNSTKRNGESALATAVSYGHYDIVSSLLRKGANPNIEARRGLAPLSQAQDARMVNLLIEHGADPNIPDRDGDLPIISLICSGYKAGAIALYRAGTDVDHKNRNGETARDYFQRYFQTDIDRATN